MLTHLTTSIRSCAECNSEAERLNADAFNYIHSVLRCEAALLYSVFFFLVQDSFFWLRNQKKEYPVRGLGLHKPHI